MLYRGDLEPNGSNENIKWGLKPKRRTFNLSDIHDILGGECDLNMLEAVVEAYNVANESTKFLAFSSQYGLHIIPAQAKNIQGRIVRTASPLDSIITVPRGERTFFQTIVALCKAVTETTGVRLEAGTCQ